MLWLKDGKLFPPPTGPRRREDGTYPPPEDARAHGGLRDAAMPHVASPRARRSSERTHREDFASVKGSRWGYPPALLCGSRRAGETDPRRYPSPDPTLTRRTWTRGDGFPAGAIDAPPGYEVGTRGEYIDGDGAPLINGKHDPKNRSLKKSHPLRQSPSFSSSSQRRRPRRRRRARHRRPPQSNAP